MTIDQASKLVRRLLAGYPNLGAHDPEAYIAALIQTMSQYPFWAGNQAIIKVDDHDPRFPPTEKQLRQWLDDSVRPYRFREQWDARIRKQMQLRKEFEAAKPIPAPDPAVQAYTNFDAAFAAYGRPIGPFEIGRQRPYRG